MAPAIGPAVPEPVVLRVPVNPLTLLAAMLSATAATGSFLVAAFPLGHYGWPAVLLALPVGALAAGALARRIEAEIKRRDPAWDDRRARPPAQPRLRFAGAGSARPRRHGRS